MPDVSDIESARDELLAKHLEFSIGPLRLDESKLANEVAADLGLKEPCRPPGSILLDLVDSSTEEVIGHLARSVTVREKSLVIQHKQFKILKPEYRRTGFGSALLSEAEDWYRACQIQAILVAADGDGSLFAARRGFSFDLTGYASRRSLEHHERSELALAAIRELIARPGIFETVEAESAPRRESVRDLLDRLESVRGVAAREVAEFKRCLPGPKLEHDEKTFRSPQEIVESGKELPGLVEGTIGRAVMRRTGWSGIKRLD